MREAQGPRSRTTPQTARTTATAIFFMPADISLWFWIWFWTEGGKKSSSIVQGNGYMLKGHLGLSYLGCRFHTSLDSGCGVSSPRDEGKDAGFRPHTTLSVMPDPDRASSVFGFSCGVSAPHDEVLLFRQKDPKPLAPGRDPSGAFAPVPVMWAAELASLRQSSPQIRICGTGAQPRPQAPGGGGMRCRGYKETKTLDARLKMSGIVNVQSFVDNF